MEDLPSVRHELTHVVLVGSPGSKGNFHYTTSERTAATYFIETVEKHDAGGNEAGSAYYHYCRLSLVDLLLVAKLVGLYDCMPLYAYNVTEK
eukprot:scaffold706_cov119-Skeletonema_dohrnii-CCMP3373.AAC.3